MVEVMQGTSDSGRGPILAIDTSTEHAGLALALGDAVHTRSWSAGRTQTTSLLPAIDGMLREAGVVPADIAAVTIATGPGTFTGLRVGMSIAKGMVLALGMPIVGIPTLEIAAGAAAAATTDAADVIAVLPAGRGRVVWQRFGPHAEERPRNTTLDELVDALASMPEALVAGELSEAQQARVADAHGLVRWQHRDPAVQIRLAKERLARGKVDDPVTLEPVYLHGVVVQSGPVQDRLKKR
jgi:tRNA threonylcarbamoyladenosine biosynthesis protein TsaB